MAASDASRRLACLGRKHKPVSSPWPEIEQAASWKPAEVVGMRQVRRCSRCGFVFGVTGLLWGREARSAEELAAARAEDPASSFIANGPAGGGE